MGLVSSLCDDKAYNLAFKAARRNEPSNGISKARGISQVVAALAVRLGGAVVHKDKLQAYADSLMVDPSPAAVWSSPEQLCLTLHDASLRASAGIRMPGDVK